MSASAPLRVLEVLTVRFSENGVTAFVLQMLRHADPGRVSFGLVCPNEPPADVAAELRSRGVEIVVLPMRNRNPLLYISRLARVVRCGNYAAVHAHGNSATLYVEMLAAKRGGAHVRIPHSHNTTCSMKAADRLLRPLFRASYTHALACGAAAGRWLYGDAPFTVIPNAVDTERFAFSTAERTRIRTSLGLAADAPVWIHVGTFNRQKNHAFLLELFAQYVKEQPGATLLLLGDGSLRAQIESDAAARGLSERVRFLGAVRDVAPYLSAADRFLLPSLHEGLPFTLLEAQCAGLPCLVSDAVTQEARLTPLAAYQPLSSPAAWVNAALALPDCSAREQASRDAIARIAAAGYGAADGAARLTDFLTGCVRMRSFALVTHKMTGGGCERVIAQIVNSFCAAGVRCTLYTECNVPSFYPLDTRVRVVPLLEGEAMRACDVPRAYRRLRSLVRSDAPDLVLAMPEKVNVWTVLFLLGTNVPVVVSERNDPKRHPENRIKRLLRRVVYPVANGFIFQTQQAADYFSPRIRARSVVLDNPLDVSSLPAPFAGEREKTIVAAGRLHPQKNFRMLIDAFAAFRASHPDWRLVIYGEGGERAALTQLLQDLPDGAAALPGQTDRLAERIDSAGMFVLSSDYEGMPNALIEAMAMGLPCIATDCPCGGPAALIAHGVDGLLSPVGDAAALSRSMARIADDPALADRLSRHALCIRARMDSATVLENWRQYLDRIAAEHK